LCLGARRELLAVLTAVLRCVLTALARACGRAPAQPGGDHSLQRAKPRHAPRASGGGEEAAVTKAGRKTPGARKRVPARVEAEEVEEEEEGHAVPQHVTPRAKTGAKAGAKVGAKGGSKAKAKAGGGSGAKKAAGGGGTHARAGGGAHASGGAHARTGGSGGGSKSSGGGARARPRGADAAVVKARADADARSRAEPRAVSRALGDGGGSSSEGADAPPAGTPLILAPPPTVAATVDASGSVRAGFDPRRIEALSLDKPRAFLFHGFLTAEECDHLVSISTAGLSKSGVVDAETGGSLISDIRTSSGAFVGRGQDAVVARIEARIAAWSQIPEDHGEAIQVLRYEKSQEYRAHYDYFFHKQGEANNRIATVLLYLSDVEEGGETVFPNTAAPAGRTGEWSECAKQGVAVKPVKGNAMLFWSMKVGGELDGACARALVWATTCVAHTACCVWFVADMHARVFALGVCVGGSSHAGCPVIRGVKWTATKWRAPTRLPLLLTREQRTRVPLICAFTHSAAAAAAAHRPLPHPFFPGAGCTWRRRTCSSPTSASTRSRAPRPCRAARTTTSAAGRGRSRASASATRASCSSPAAPHARRATTRRTWRRRRRERAARAAGRGWRGSGVGNGSRAAAVIGRGIWGWEP
jgi:prolyl 4-hydroxylase